MHVPAIVAKICAKDYGSDNAYAVRNQTVAPSVTSQQLVSVMFVNNEIGVVQDISAIAKVVHDSGGLLHVDSAQATGKVSINVDAFGIDLMSMCAHKTYGPKGVGALYVQADLQNRLRPVIYGGGHEKGLRSGTLPTHQLVGFGEAFRIAKGVEIAGDEIKQLRDLRDRLLACLMSLDGVAVNGSMLHRVPHNLNVRFTGIDADALLQMMPDVCLSTGSACSSGIPEPSHVLRALGLSIEEAEGSVRITLGRFNTIEDIDFAADRLINSVSRLREVSASS